MDATKVCFHRVTLTLVCLIFVLNGDVLGQEKITFEDHIKPMFRTRCAACHNPDKKNGDLDVTNYTSLMLGGGSGEVVSPGDVGGSYLFALVNHDDEPAMPPDSPRIPDAEISLLSQWIEQGALENKSSKARMSNKPKVAALDASPLERPTVVISPAHLALQPSNVVSRPNAVLTMHTSPWASVMALGGPGQVQLYDTTTRELTGILDFPEGIINVLKFSRNGSLLMGAGGRPGAQGIVAIWDLRSGRRLATLDEEIDAILTADLSPDQQQVFVGGPQKMVRVYSTATEELAFEVKKHTEWLTAGEFSPDGVLLATADRNGGIHVWETFTGREYLTLPGHGAAVTGLSWRGDSNLLASCSEDGTVKLWEMENGGQVRSWNAHGGGTQAVEFARDGRLVTTGRDRTGKLWDQAGKQLAAFSGLADIGTSVTHCDETNQIVVGDWAGNAIVFSADGKEVGRLEVTPPSLESRLTLAEKTLGEATAKLTPEQAKQKEMDTQLVALRKKLTQGMQDMSTNEANLKAAVAAQAADEKLLAENMAMAKSLSESIAVIQKVLPSLQLAGDKLTEAVNASGGDAELKQVAAAAAKALEARKATLAKTQKTVEDKRANIAELTKKIQERKLAIMKLETEIAKLVADMAEMNKSQVSMAAELEKQNEVVAVAEEAHAAAQSEVNRWKSEVQFVAKMAEFSALSEKIEAEWESKAEALSQAETALAEVTKMLTAQTSEMATAESQHAAQVAKLGELTKQGEAMQQTMVKTETDSKSMTASVQKMTQGVTALGDAVKHANSALELAGEDKELAAAVKQLRELQVGKEQALEAAKTKMTELNQSIASLKTQLAENATALDAGKKLAGEIVVKMDGIKQALTETQKKVSAQQAAVDAATIEVEALDKKLEEIDQQRQELQGISA